MLRVSDGSKVIQEASWMREDLNLGLAGLIPTPLPLHHRGSNRERQDQWLSHWVCASLANWWKGFVKRNPRAHKSPPYLMTIGLRHHKVWLRGYCKRLNTHGEGYLLQISSISKDKAHSCDQAYLSFSTVLTVSFSLFQVDRFGLLYPWTDNAQRLLVSVDNSLWRRRRLFSTRSYLSLTKE